MDHIDYLDYDFDSDINRKKFTLLKDVGAIMDNLTKGSKKFSDKLDNSVKIISDMVKSIQFGYSNNIESTAELENKSGSMSSCVSKFSETEAETSDLLPKWVELQSMMEKMSFEFKSLAEKFTFFDKDLKNIERFENLEGRVELPTEVNGIRLCPESFIKVLRYYPVPVWKKRKEEIKLRRRLIMSHYERNSALRFLSELQELPYDHQLEGLVSSAAARLKNTTKILEKNVRELRNLHDSYKYFLEQYIIALDSPEDPEHSSPEYINGFTKMISKATANGQGEDLERKAQAQLFKKSTEEMGSTIKGLVTRLQSIVSKKSKQN